MSNMKIICDEGIENCPATIPMKLLNEKHAMTNHGQSLEKLNRRGGLGPDEAIAIIENRKWQKMDAQNAANILNRLVQICTL